MFFKKKSKLLIGGSLGVSLLGVLVAAIATSAWFSLDSQPVSFSGPAANANLSIDNANVTGYKIKSSLGTDGFPDYSSSTVASKKGTTYEVSNHNQDVADTNFDVPEAGLGYYLVKKNATNTYKYKYNSSSYSWKFKELDNSNVNYLKIDSVSMTTSDSYIVRKYSYETSTYSTVNEKVKVVKDKGNFTLTSDPETWEIIPSTAGTYSVWFNKSTLKLSFELQTSLEDINVTPANIPSKGNGNTRYSINEGSSGPTRKDANATTGNKRVNVLVNSNTNSWIWDASAKIAVYYNNSSWVRPGADTSLNYGNTSGNETKSNTRKIVISSTTYYVATVDLGANWINGGAWHIKAGRSNSAETDIWNDVEMANVSNQSSVWSNYYNTVMYDGNSISSWGFYFKCTYHFGNNNSTVKSDLVYANSFSPANPAAISGYTFKGWYTNSTLTSAYSTTTLTGDINLYAKYEKNGGVDTTYNIKLYLNGNTDWGNTVYCYAFGGSGTYNSYSNVYIPENKSYSVTRSQTSYTNGNTGATEYYYIYSFNISTSFPNVLFRKYDSFVANCDQTVDIEDANDHAGDTFVITSGGGDNKWSGSWYASVAGASRTFYDYYIYDQAEYLQENSGTPSVYCWKNNVAGDGTNTFFMPHNSANAVENGTWPGTSLLTTDADGTTPLPDHVYRFRVSSTYDSFVLSNGKNKSASGAFQTQDLTGGSGLSGHGQASGTARSASTYYFVFSGKTSQGGGTYYQVNGSWTQNISTISLKVAFTIYDGSTYTLLDTLTAGVATNGLYTLRNDFYVSTVPYKPTITTKSQINSGNDYVISDEVNGIVYDFTVPSTLVWYKDTDWDETFDIDDGETGYSGSLYIRAVCDIRNYISIYVDDSSWSNEALEVKTSGNDSVYFYDNGSRSWQVATGLYRVTLRNDWMIQLSSHSHTSYNLASNDGGVPNMGSGTAAYYRVNTSTSTTYEYLYIEESGAGSDWTWVDYKSTSATRVWVQKYSNSNWSDVTDGQLLHGDGTGNKFILESGLRLTNGDIIRVYDKNTSTAYGYSSYVDGNKSKHRYVATGTDGSSDDNAITISNLGSAGTKARFNFYVTSGDKLSIAMVPDFGNGYYIMEYDGYNTENYIGAIKMDSEDYSATYEGYYCSNTSKKIYIRRYLNAVDEICDDLSTTTLSRDATMQKSSGNDQYTITFGATGHYTIRVTGKVVDITPYSVDDFFSLNKLNLGLVTGNTNDKKQQDIYDQKTAVVIEIPFFANNVFDTTVTLKTNSDCDFVGVRFAVYTSKQGTPYETMRGNRAGYTSSYLTSADTGSFSDSRSQTITAGTSSTCYAYVLIDYLYSVDSSDLVSAIPEIDFYLQINQK